MVRPRQRLLLLRPFGDGCGCIAQLVEQLTLNQRVAGSSPATPTNKINEIAKLYVPQKTACGTLAEREIGLGFAHEILLIIGHSSPQSRDRLKLI